LIQAWAKSIELLPHVLPHLQNDFPATRVRRKAHIGCCFVEKHFNNVELEAASSEKKREEDEPTRE
jgi:hypothetical protein